MSRRRRPNPRLAKIHRNYTVDEVARTLGTHKNTVRAWITKGLPTIDSRRPTLIHGLDLARFLETRRKGAKQTCGPGQIYCVKCRFPKTPAGRMADYIPITATSGNLRGICPDCEILIHRRVSRAKLDSVRGNLEVAFPHPAPRIRERTVPSVDCDSQKDRASNEDV